MLPKQFPQLSAKEQHALGMPEGINFFTPAQFEGINQSDSRIGMPDTDLFYLENLIHIGAYNLRSVWDAGTALYTNANKTIICFFSFNIGATNYFAVFFSDGTAIQVNAATGATTTISSSANTFYNSGLSTQLPICGQWGAEFLIISNNFSTNNYWIWDGTLLYTSGTLGPLPVIANGGSAYTSAPTVSAFGGSGSGATFTATVSNGSVVSLIVTNSGTGYEPGDIVQLRFSGGGSDDEAQLTAVLTSGIVQSLILTNAGSGYTAGTYALGFSGGAGTGAAGTYTVGADMTVSSVTLTAGGSGYTGSPTVSFPSGGGSGASAVATITAGSVSSVTVVHGGSGFTQTPTLTFVGGSGSGATATAVLSAGAISSVTVTAGGSGYNSAPAVKVQTGLNRAAHATITIMPFGVSGSSSETFQSRVWLGFPYQTGAFQVSGTHNGDVILVSAPGSINDFATSDGGVAFANTDSFLKHQYTNIRQSNGYLYPLADSSIAVISNVQTSGNPTTTTFNYQNVDPQVGTSWRDSCEDFSRTILFGNPLGVWGLYGGAVTKVSKKLDTLFTNAIFPPTANALLPSAAVANVFSQRIYCLLMTFKDPFTQAMVNKMVCWDEKNWFIASQTPNLTYIATQEINSNLTAWGTDGTSLYPLFNTPSNLTKKISTKLYGVNSSAIKKQAYTFGIQAQDLSSAQSGVSFNVNIDTNYLNPATNSYSYSLPTISFSAPQPTYPMFTTSSVDDVYGMNIGATVTSTSSDFTINFLGLGYINYVAELALPGG